MKEIHIGQKVRVNASGDLMMDRKSGALIGRAGVVRRQLRDGRYAVDIDEQEHYFAKRNLDVIDSDILIPPDPE